jgi:hypothetical protein
MNIKLKLISYVKNSIYFLPILLLLFGGACLVIGCVEGKEVFVYAGFICVLLSIFVQNKLDRQ